MAKKDRTTGDTAAASTSLGDLLRARGLQPTQAPESAPDVAESAPDESAPDTALSGRIVLERTKKGRGGKTVTVIKQTGLDPDALQALARELRRDLGCGTSVSDDAIVVQGDQVDRLRPLLLARGAKKVVGG